MNYYIYITENGAPKEELSPSWYSLYQTSDGTDKTDDANLNSTINEIGGGFYKFDITFGESPWDTTTTDLVGVIDANADPSIGSTTSSERFIPIEISIRNLGLVRIAHKGIQSKTTGDVVIYKTDGTTPELKLNMTDSSGEITRNPESN